MTDEVQQTDNLAEVRAHLFGTLRDLRAGKIDIEKAKTINDTAQVLINSAKVEVDYIKQTGAVSTGFIDTSVVESTKPGLTSGRVHRIR